MAIERLFIGEGVKEVEVKKYLFKELKRAGLASIVIRRTPLVTRIVICCDRPALVIGRKGKNVKDITHMIEETYKIEKPELEIKKIDNPNLEPNIVAYRIASALERGMNPRKVGYKALQAMMRDNAKGAEIIMSGKLIGKGGRARTLKMKAGYMKKCGFPSITQVLHGHVIANCKPGTIGVEVNLVPPNVHFPDEIDIVQPEVIEVVEEVVEVQPAQLEAAVEAVEKTEKKAKKAPKPKKEGEKLQSKKKEVKETKSAATKHPGEEKPEKKEEKKE